MNDYKLPAWVDMNVFEKLKDISAKTFIFSGMTKQIQRFRTGLLLSDIWQHISDDNDERRLYIYSTVNIFTYLCKPTDYNVFSHFSFSSMMINYLFL